MSIIRHQSYELNISTFTGPARIDGKTRICVQLDNMYGHISLTMEGWEELVEFVKDVLLTSSNNILDMPEVD